MNPGNTTISHPATVRGVPAAMTIAGSDSGGGAGVQADLKAFSALGVYGASTITALTAQNTRAVNAIHEVPAEFVRQQMETVLSDIRIDAIKIGMLANVDIIRTISEVLEQHPAIPVVLDPVMVAKSGDSLLHTEAIDALRHYLFPRATLITPNLPEAALLLGNGKEAGDLADMEAQAARLAEMGSACVLLKGGHLNSTDCTDLLLQNGQLQRFTQPRIQTGNTHGTGCTLSSAIAAELARGASVSDAVQAAEIYVHAAIIRADELQIGSGHGPVHHFHALWPQT
ncbi:bifunctional hydroxymethylpyrimidine kinase/phosphomethylpyrimidine kinase [Granulosicoccus sp. 3-233]|uniref:bifunctional hydroxymethylpyrimidine kinase/phosphomethylpyrimidine kinase n=1 Tax=Granulosicoccus sp. 3-233 TaxID=3417969 RepID=UPI003D350C23